jgi:hypothetical protein
LGKKNGMKYEAIGNNIRNIGDKLNEHMRTAGTL